MTLIWTLLLLLTGSAQAAPDAEIGGHVKGFFSGTFPYEHLLMPEDPLGNATLDVRLKAAVKTPHLTLELHPTVTGQMGSNGLGFSTGVGQGAPEALPLSADLTEGDDLRLRFRVDRANLAATAGPFRFTFGRQPITFGMGQVFTPLDLVAPFTPASVDTAYKPGVDAVRADLFVGMSGRISLLAAYLGEWGPEGSAFVAQGQFTIVTVDVAPFVGHLRGETVLGASVYAPIGPIGLYGDAALTIIHRDDDRPEFRGVVGVFGQPAPTVTLSVEVYGQTFGTDEASKYLVVSSRSRWTRGDLWLSGHLYLGGFVGWEVVPLVNFSAGLVANLLDPSVFLTPSLSISLAANADLSFGGFVGIGERPEDVELTDLVVDGVPLEGDELLQNLGVQSEFGLMPASLWLRGSFYF